MNSSSKDNRTYENSVTGRRFVSVMENSSLYKEFLAEREEILNHKWLESEKAGYDIGFECALLDWVRKHREKWCSSRRSSARNQMAGQS